MDESSIKKAANILLLMRNTFPNILLELVVQFEVNVSVERKTKSSPVQLELWVSVAAHPASRK